MDGVFEARLADDGTLYRTSVAPVLLKFSGEGARTFSTLLHPVVFKVCAKPRSSSKDRLVLGA